jgi:hypothetical protein
MSYEVRSYIFSKFHLEGNCVIYPAPNLVTGEFITTNRPDFKIVKDGKFVGYIEVELGKDISQVNKYNRNTPEDVRIYSIFGKKSDGGDLSLEEIFYFLKNIQSKTSKESQPYWSMELLLKLIEYYVIEGNFKSNNKRAPISDKMRISFLITALYEGIGTQNILDKDSEKAEKGKILLNTVAESGFSVRVFARNSSSGSFSLMWRSGGLETIHFPAYVKMKKYIANKEFIERYTDLLIELGCTDIKEISERQSTGLNIRTVEDNVNELIDCIKLLLH